MPTDVQRRTVVPPAELIGWLIDGRYRLDAILGRGGAGVVYRGLQQNLNREVAVKLMKQDQTASASRLKRFSREIEIIAQLNHPNIVRVFDSGRDPVLGVHYIAMELVRGPTLSDLLRGHRFTPALAVEVALQIAAALTEPHRLGIVHRDIKPLNVLLTAHSDDTLGVKVVDFGIARPVVSDTAVTSEGTVVGSPVYMPPEVVRGEPPDGRADLYSLGTVLYEMLTGDTPFQAATPVALMLRHAVDKPLAIAESLGGDFDVPSLVELVDAMLSKQPDGRPESAKAVMHRLIEIRRTHELLPITLRGTDLFEALSPNLITMTRASEVEHDPRAETAHVSIDGLPLEDPFAGWHLSERAQQLLDHGSTSADGDTMELPSAPTPATNLVGRRIEIQRITEAIERGESLALVGPSGVGKTTIATHYLATSGRSYITFDAFSLTFDELVERMVTELSIAAGGSSAAKLVLIAEALQGFGILAIDDVGFDPAPLGPLLATFRGVVLLTTHHPPEGFAVLPITPWTIPDAEIEESDPWRLFESVARRENAGFELQQSERDDVRAIVKALSGHPLGIALAARRAATTSPAVVRELLQTGVGTLRTRDGEERHRSLDAALDATWVQLQPDDQRMLYTMSLLRRPVGPAALATVCGVSLGDALDGIARLVRSGVVTRSRFPRPLELFVDLARSRYPQSSPNSAPLIQTAIRTRAIELAESISVDLEHEENLGDAPSFWDYVVREDGEGLELADFAGVLAAWLTWQRHRRSAGGSAIDTEHVRELVERVGDWAVWYLAGRAAEPGTESSLDFFERSIPTARTARQRHLSHIMRAMTLAWQLDVENAQIALDAAFAENVRTPESFWAEGQICLMIGDKERARAASETLIHDPNAAEILRVRAVGIWAYAGVPAADGARALRESGDSLVRMGHLDAAAVRYLTTVEFLAIETDDLEAALAMCETARDLAERLQSSALIARTAASSAIAYLHHGDFENVLVALHDARRPEQGHADENDFIRFVARWQLAEDVTADWPRMRRWADTRRAFWSITWRVIEIALERDEARRTEFVRQHHAAQPESADVFDAMNAIHESSARARDIITRFLAADIGSEPGARQAALYLQRVVSQNPPNA